MFNIQGVSEENRITLSVYPLVYFVIFIIYLFLEYMGLASIFAGNSFFTEDFLPIGNNSKKNLIHLWKKDRFEHFEHHF